MKAIKQRMKAPVWSWVRGLVVCVCWVGWMSFQVACGSATDCNKCIPNSLPSCFDNGKFIRTCEQSQATGCWVASLTPCQTGSCVKTSTGTAKCMQTCQPGTQTCQPGEVKCDGQALVQCELDADTNCTSFVRLQVCAADQACNAADKNCVAKSVCTPGLQAGQRCDGDGVYAYDDCGTKMQLLTKCKEGEVCTGDACVEDKCIAKVELHTKKCEGKDVYWFDDCGVRRKLAESCPEHLKCIDGKCDSCTVTKAEDTKKCDGDALHWYNNCGEKGQKIEDCQLGCENGACKSNVPPQCQGIQNCDAEGAKGCKDKDTQVCQKDANGCLVWNKVATCGFGKKCDQGQCVDEDPNCPDKCQAGGSKCDGKKIVTCEKVSDTCHRWSQPTACSAGECTGGKCQVACSSTCTAAEKGNKLCSGTGYQECEEVQTGCFKWSTSVKQCPTNQECQNNQCVTKQTGPQPGALGSACRNYEHSSCQPGTCLTNRNTGKGFCTKKCTSSAACGSGFRCHAFGSSKYCSQTCTSSSNCPSGFACQSTSGVKICLPS